MSKENDKQQQSSDNKPTDAENNIVYSGFGRIVQFGFVIPLIFYLAKNIIEASSNFIIFKFEILKYLSNIYFPTIILFFVVICWKKLINISFEFRKINLLGKIFNKEQITKEVAIDGLSKDFDYDNDDITLKVFRRLKLRYGILKSIITDAQSVNAQLKDPDNTQTINPSTTQPYNASIQKNLDRDRLYKCVTTDLFVEKALSYLNRKARKYERYSLWLFVLIFILSTIAIGCAFYSVYFQDFSKFNTYDIAVMWGQISIVFIKNFTFYGLIMIIISFLYRMIKSLYDQAERIKDRRHALRQGRLYVHLKGGEVNLEEMKEAFNWNTTQPNAFSEFNPDAQAPFGALSKEALKTIQESVKTVQFKS